MDHHRPPPATAPHQHDDPTPSSPSLPSSPPSPSSPRSSVFPFPTAPVPSCSSVAKPPTPLVLFSNFTPVQRLSHWVSQPEPVSIKDSRVPRKTTKSEVNGFHHASEPYDKDKDPWRFAGRRSVVFSTQGIVACTQPSAANCGLEILRKGGNAADAVVAVAAALNVTEPCLTGIGGDMFLLYRDAATGRLSALNGSGRAGSKYTLDFTRRQLGGDDAPDTIPDRSVHAVTVPGAAAGWVDVVEKLGSGKLDLATVLAPAIKLAEEGYPVTDFTSRTWHIEENLLRNAFPGPAELMKHDPAAPAGYRVPRPGEIMRNPGLAQTFRTLAAEGKPGFYSGRIAEEIVRACRELGGHLDLDDLRHHLDAGTDEPEPISLRLTGFGLGDENALDAWEHPPNGQGIVALMALGMLQVMESRGTIPRFTAGDHNSVPYLHAIIETLRLAFTDAYWFVADPDETHVPTAELLSVPYLESRAKLFDPNGTVDIPVHGEPGPPNPAVQGSDTVYFSIVDGAGNAASFINSNCHFFGTGIIPRGCGFTLQDRACGFSLRPGHPNVIAPRKRPYHTIIPGMVTRAADGELHSVFGVMGGNMQPQGHVQVLLGQIVAGLDPQQALDAPRVCVQISGKGEGAAAWSVLAEEGMGEDVLAGLGALGHNVTVVRGYKRSVVFGRGQIVKRTWDAQEGRVVWAAGSDMRGDGAAYPVSGLC